MLLLLNPLEFIALFIMLAFIRIVIPNVNENAFIISACYGQVYITTEIEVLPAATD